MNKFIGKKTSKTTKKVSTKAIKPVEKVEVIKKGEQEFITCPRCGWVHKYGTEKCRFCGKKLGE